MDNSKSSGKLIAENRSLRQTVTLQAARLESSIKLLSALYSLSTVPIKSASTGEAGKAILEMLVREFDEIANCSLLLFEPEEGHLRLVAARGQKDLYGGPREERNRDLTFEPGEGVAGMAFAENRPIFWTAGTAEDKIFKPIDGLIKPDCLACLPLSPLDRRLGVLNLSYDKVQSFDLPRRRDLVLLSGVVANMIHTIMLRNQVADNADSLAEKIEALQKEISERERAEHALVSAEVRNRLVTDAVHDVIWSMDLPDMRFTFLSPSVQRQTGYTVEEALNWRLEQILTPESQQLLLELLAREIARDQAEDVDPNRTIDIEYEQIRKSGEKFWVEDTITGVRDGDGRLTGLVGVSRDLTERKRLERQLQQAHKMEAVGTLAGGVAHDFNNILQAMMGYTGLIAASGELSYQSTAWLEKVSWGASKAADLVQRLLTFSRKVEPKLRSLDLNREVAECVELLKRTLPKMVDIKTDLAADLPKVGCDATQIEQIILNLATNARDAMPGGGELHLQTGRMTMDEEFCSQNLGSCPGDYVMLKVSDSGPGIPAEVLPHIFEPFYTTKEVGKGTGLGLAMVYGIVKNHRGYIVCESRPGQGTAFCIYLPLLQKTMPPVAEPKAQAPLSGGNETILLVDDEKTLLELGEMALSKWGYQVLTASTGEEALEMLQADESPTDLVVLDLGMPGMGGRACLKQLVKIRPEVRVIVSTGYSDSPMDDQALSMGAQGFLGKPYKLSALAAKVREVLDAG